MDPQWDDYYMPWGRGSFATEVKRIFCETFMFDPKLIDEWKVKNEPPPGFDLPIRNALIMIGDGFRQIMGDIWIRRAFLDASSYFKVYSDARYLNETRKIRQIGGPNILICKPDRINFIANRSESELRPYIMWCLQTGREGVIASWPEYQALCQEDGQDEYLAFWGNDPENDHESRKDIRILTGEFVRNLSKFDLFIRNDGTVDQLYSKVHNVVIPYLKSNFGYTEQHEQDCHV